MQDISFIKVGLCIFLLLFPFVGLRAKPGTVKSEFSLSYGRHSFTEGLPMGIFAYGDYEDGGYHALSNSGNIFGTYRHFMGDRWAIGGTVGMQHILYQYSNTGGKLMTQDFSTDVKIYTAAFECKVIYTNPACIAYFYGVAGVGARLFSEVQTPNQPRHTLPPLFVNSQFTLTGLHIGRRLAMFAELGFGYKGVFNFGIAFGG